MTTSNPPGEDDDGILLEWAQEHAALLIFATFMCLVQLTVACFYCYSTGTFPLKEKILLRADELTRAREERRQRRHTVYTGQRLANVVYPALDLATGGTRTNTPPNY
jgi:hypothetical protein